jgi:hypothetical protein
MVMPRHQNEWKMILQRQLTNASKNVAYFKYLGRLATEQNLILE